MTLSSLRLVTWSLRHSVTWSLGHFVTFHLCLWFLGAASAGAQVASWSRTYGGTNSDWADAIIPTSDGGYVVAGGDFVLWGWQPGYLGFEVGRFGECGVAEDLRGDTMG
jgi:hypothetical protein